MKHILKKIVVTILTAEASLLLSRHKPKIIAVTGSVGKTSTKDAIYSAIKGSVSARKSEKTFNSDIGVPLSVLGLPNGWSNPFVWFKNVVEGFFLAIFSSSYPNVLVLEMGIDRPGDMGMLTKWIKPDIVVLTRLPDVPTHVEYFSSPEAVVAEKMTLVQALKSEGILVYNADDTIIEKERGVVRQKHVGFSRYLETDFTARADKFVYTDNRVTGMRFMVLHNGVEYTISLADTVGTQHVYACTAALAVASELGIPIATAAENLSQHTTPRSRMRLITGLKSTTLIDDSYNSSPAAAEIALQTLDEIKYAKRKIAVLGDMLELGKFSADEHVALGKRVANIADILLTVGVRSRKIAEAALAAGMDESNILQYEQAERAGRELQNILQPGDVVLIKASQGIRSEKIVVEVMADPDRAEELIVRQDRVWRNK